MRREKPRVSAFTSADIPKILALRPDLVFAFSDLQADIVAELIRAGVHVHCHRQERFIIARARETANATVANDQHTNELNRKIRS